MPESSLGRIIHTTNPTRQRAAVLKRMASAIREHSGPDGSGKDSPELAEQLIPHLKEIRESVNRTAEAWEKRDYWLKADAFRRQWRWVEETLTGMTGALQAGDRPSLQAHVLEVERRSQPSPSQPSSRRRC